MQAHIAAKLYRSDRASDRVSLGRESTMRDEHGAPVDIVIEDVSESGCRIRLGEPPASGEVIRIGIAGIGVKMATVIWHDAAVAGCAFAKPLTPFELEKTLTADTLVMGSFAPHDAVAPVVVDPAQDVGRDLGPRDKFFIMLAAAAAAWIPFLILFRLIAALV